MAGRSTVGITVWRTRPERHTVFAVLYRLIPGNVLREDATEEQKRHAVELAGQMKDFPEEGSVLVTEDCVVVRLSEVKEQMPTDWW